jgi:preprotein translocase subunit SecG
MMTIPLTLGIGTMWVGFATVAFLAICLMLVLIVLIQRPQGGGLSGAFGAGGGGSSGQSAFGAKTGDALTIATVAIFVMFLAGAVALNFALRPTEAQQAEAELAAAETEEDAENGASADTEGEVPEVVLPTDEDAPASTDEITDPATDTAADPVTDDGDAEPETPATDDDPNDGGR